jgi:CTP synthase (UTP-ammonia lyase)
MIGIVGDYQPGHPTHTTLGACLADLGAAAEWVPTDAVPPNNDLVTRCSGLWIAPVSPYKSMNGALRAIRLARERHIPLVGT